jgi:hypothetical protein
MRKLISDQVIQESHELYKDGIRAQVIADDLGISIQHLLRLFRKLEGKPVWTKKHKTVMLGDHKNPKLMYFPKPYRNHDEDTK